jgi:hypothetical protein
MEEKHFEKYQDFLQKRKMNKNIDNLQNYDSNNISKANKTEPSFNLNLENKNLGFEQSNDEPISLSSLRRQFNSKGKNNLIIPNFDKNYKTFYVNNSPKENNKVNNIYNNNIEEKKKNLKIYSSINEANNRQNIENMINSYLNKNYNSNNKYKTNNNKLNQGKNIDKDNARNRAFSANNNKNKYDLKGNSAENFNLKRPNNNKNIFNYKKKNNYNSFIKNNRKKLENRNLSKSGLSESISLNKELDHLLSSFNFNNISNNCEEIKIDDDKSIKIHFRNLLYLVKELNARNDLLKKELRNKDNLISSLENQIKNSNKGKGRKSINNVMLKEYSDNVLLDNSKLKSEVLKLENKLKQQKIHYEDLLNDYKKRLNKEKSRNNVMDNNLKNIENKFKNSNTKIVDMKDELKDVTLMKAKLEDMNEKYEIINSGQQKRIEELENQLKVVLTLVKNLFSKENNVLFPMRTKLFFDISNLGKTIENN